jgi:ParB family chromosome partitioning protein
MNKRLGKGIEALISSYSTEENDRYIDGAIPLKNIIPNKCQPRKEFDESAMEDLINSVRENGVIQPITVRHIKKGQYEIIAGERRFRAAIALKLDSVPAYILSVDTDVEMMEYAIIENVQREDLNPVEEAEGYAILSGKHGLSQEEISKKVGKSRPEIANTLRLMKLPPNIRNSLKLSRENGGISKGHARALLALRESTKMNTLFQKIVNEGLSVRQTETLVKKYSKNQSLGKKVKPQKSNPLLAKVEGDLMSHLGTKVIIQKNTKGKGRINIEFYSEDDLERIIQIISES